MGRSATEDQSHTKSDHQRYEGRQEKQLDAHHATYWKVSPPVPQPCPSRCRAASPRPRSSRKPPMQRTRVLEGLKDTLVRGNVVLPEVQLWVRNTEGLSNLFQ